MRSLDNLNGELIIVTIKQFGEIEKVLGNNAAYVSIKVNDNLAAACLYMKRYDGTDIYIIWDEVYNKKENK